MATIEKLFVTQFYRATLIEPDQTTMLDELESICQSMAVDDTAGIKWCRKNHYPGYTSYASVNDLPWRFPQFKKIIKMLDRHVADFVKELELDLMGRKIELESIWVNVLPPGGVHTSHIHPHSVISGTFYVATPPGSSALKLEDPRLGFMMASPPRKKKARPENQTFIFAQPEPGTVLLWESWLRHEVPVNEADSERISISFNYSYK